MKVTLSPGALRVTVVPWAKLAGVIVTLFVPEVDTFNTVLIWPSVELAANVQGAAADVASTSVIAVVKLIAVDVEPSPVIDCDVCCKDRNEGILLNTSAAEIFLLIGLIN